MSTAVNIAMKQYKSVGVHTSIAEASAHRLIQMLMGGALEKIARAKGNIDRSEIAKKGENIGMAISIIDSLQASLDMEKGGEISKNLDALYDYMIRCLLEASANNNAAKLTEVNSLLLEVKGAWDAIPDEAKHVPSTQ